MLLAARFATRERESRFLVGSCPPRPSAPSIHPPPKPPAIHFMAAPDDEDSPRAHCQPCWRLQSAPTGGRDALLPRWTHQLRGSAHRRVRRMPAPGRLPRLCAPRAALPAGNHGVFGVCSYCRSGSEALAPPLGQTNLPRGQLLLPYLKEPRSDRAARPRSAVTLLSAARPSLPASLKTDT